MPAPSKPSVPLSRIPSVYELTELLGFHHAPAKETNTFVESARSWRKACQSSSIQDASELLNWNQVSNQLHLEEMAVDFLDKAGNGERFWSPGRSWNHDSEVQYPEDRARIIELLKQLFWRQNKYAVNNAQYMCGHKVSESRNQSTETITPMPQFESPKQAEFIPQVDTVQPDLGAGSFEIKSPKNSLTSAMNKTWDKLPTPRTLSPTEVDTDFLDIFEISDDSDSSEDISFSPTTKRRRPVSNARETPRKKKKCHLGEPVRRTGRKPKTRHVPDAVPDDEVEQLINEEMEAAREAARNAQSTGHPITSDSPRQKGQRTRLTDAYDSPYDPLPGSIIFSRRPAPTAPMYPSVSQKSTPPKSKLLKESLSSHLSDPNKGSTIIGNSSTDNVGKLNITDQDQRPRKNPVLELECKQASQASLPMAIASVATGQSSKAHDERPLPHSDSTPHTSANVQHNSPEMHGEEQEPPAARANLGFPNAGLKSALPNDSSCSTGVPTVVAERSEMAAQVSSPLKYRPPTVSENILDSPVELSIPPQVAPVVENETQSPTVPLILTQAASEVQPILTPLSQSTSSKPRQKTQIPLWIITREPKYTEEQWDSGKFMGTPLSSFIEGVSQVTQRNYIEKIKLTLEAPSFNTKITIFQDAEDSWASAKTTFMRKLKDAKAEARVRGQIESLTFRILVEPFYKEGFFPSSSIEVEEDEFEF